MKTILLLIVLVGLLCARVSYSAPEVSTWGTTFKVVYNDTLTTMISAADSIAVTDSVNVFGARYVTMIIQSTGAAGTGAFNGGTGVAYDTLAVPVLQVTLPGGQWTAGSVVGSSVASPVLGPATAFTYPLTTSTQVNQVTRIACTYVMEPSAGGTHVPYVGAWWRWRVRSNNTRRCQSGVNPACVLSPPTGRVTMTVFVWR